MALVLFALGPLFGHEWQRCFPASLLQEKLFRRPNEFLFLTGVSVLCFMSGRRSHIPHF